MPTATLDTIEFLRDVVATIKSLENAYRISLTTRITASTMSCSMMACVSFITTST